MFRYDSIGKVKCTYTRHIIIPLHACLWQKYSALCQVHCPTMSVFRRGRRAQIEYVLHHLEGSIQHCLHLLCHEEFWAF